MSIFQRPKTPDGRTPEAVYMQRLADIAVQQAACNVQGMKVNRTTRGIVMVPQEVAGGGGSAKVRCYRLKDVFNDYVVGHTFDGTTEGTADAYIAKEWSVRCSLTTKTVLGVEHTYTYAPGPSETWAVGASTLFNMIRTDADGTLPDETQRVEEPWTEDEVFAAIQANTGVTHGAQNEEGDWIDADGEVVETEAEARQIPVMLLMVGRSAHWAGPL